MYVYCTYKYIYEYDSWILCELQRIDIWENRKKKFCIEDFSLNNRNFTIFPWTMVNGTFYKQNRVYCSKRIWQWNSIAGRKWNYTFQHFKLLLKLKYMSFSFYLLTINMKRGLEKKTKLYISSDNKHRHCLLIQIL